MRSYTEPNQDKVLPGLPRLNEKICIKHSNGWRDVSNTTMSAATIHQAKKIQTNYGSGEYRSEVK